MTIQTIADSNRRNKVILLIEKNRKSYFVAWENARNSDYTATLSLITPDEDEKLRTLLECNEANGLSHIFESFIDGFEKDGIKYVAVIPGTNGQLEPCRKPGT